MYENIFEHKTKYHKNDLVPDRKVCVDKEKNKCNRVTFAKGLIREGTTLKYRGFVITNKGTQVDPALLNPDSLKDRF